jgi:hypothetical protein
VGKQDAVVANKSSKSMFCEMRREQRWSEIKIDAQTGFLYVRLLYPQCALKKKADKFCFRSIWCFVAKIRREEVHKVVNKVVCR